MNPKPSLLLNHLTIPVNVGLITVYSADGSAGASVGARAGEGSNNSGESKDDMYKDDEYRLGGWDGCARVVENCR